MPKKTKEDYLRDGTFREFVRWSAVPRQLLKREAADGESVPTSIREWAEKHDKGVRTLYRWKNTEAFRELTNEIIEEWLHGSLPDVVKQAYEVATEEGPSGHNDRKLLMEIAGMTPDSTIHHKGEVSHEHSHTVEDYRTMDEGALRRQFREELRAQEQFADKSDEELDGIIDALLGAGTDPAALPEESEEVEEVEYVITEPSSEDDI